MSDLDARIEALRKADRKATPGPWRYDDGSDHGSPIVFSGEKPVIGFHQSDYDSEAWFEIETADGELIAALRNEALAIIEEQKRADAGNEEALEVAELTAAEYRDERDAWQEKCRELERELEEERATHVRIRAAKNPVIKERDELKRERDELRRELSGHWTSSESGEASGE